MMDALFSFVCLIVKLVTLRPSLLALALDDFILLFYSKRIVFIQTTLLIEFDL
jgi:hypothetical protein